MPGKPAARVGDKIICLFPQATPAAAPHAPAGMPIIPPGAPTVLVGGAPAARVGDQSICPAPAPAPNPITLGAFPVLMGGSPATRVTDQASHPGSLIGPPCCPTVTIGLAGTSGNPWDADQACQVARNGRNPPPGAQDNNGNQLQPNTPGQSYNNCGVESSRQIINQQPGVNLSQEQMMGQWNQVTNGNPAIPPPASLYNNGGTDFPQIQQLLGNNGVTSSTVLTGTTPSIQAVQTSIAQGQGVIAPVYASNLWPNNVVTNSGMVPGSSTGPHYLNVTGLKYDDNGNVTHVIVNDTGLGTCKQEVPIATFNNALMNNDRYIVTNNPVW
jgi:uncharacterized Zn-binding protein involved in type VI secretion